MTSFARPLGLGLQAMGDSVSRHHHNVLPVKPVLKPVMAEQSSKEPAPSTVIVVMGASVGKIAS